MSTAGHSEGLPTIPGHPGGPPDRSRTSGRVSHHFWTSVSVSRQLPDIRESLPTNLGQPGRHHDYSQTSGRASRQLPDIREGL